MDKLVSRTPGMNLKGKQQLKMLKIGLLMFSSLNSIHLMFYEYFYILIHF